MKPLRILTLLLLATSLCCESHYHKRRYERIGRPRTLGISETDRRPLTLYAGIHPSGRLATLFGDNRLFSRSLPSEFTGENMSDGKALLMLLQGAFTNTVAEDIEPYGLTIMSTYEREHDEPEGALIITEITLEIDDTPPVVVHGPDHEPLRIPYDEHPSPFHAVARTHINLADNLAFADGQLVTVVIRYRPPGSDEISISTTGFEGVAGTKVETTGDFLDVLTHG